MDIIDEFVNKAISETSGEAIINDKHFTVRYYSGIKDLCVYADNGMTSLFSRERVKPEELELYKQLIAESIRDYIDGFIRCSNCGKLIRVEDIAGEFFAGRYCNDCWESHYKALANTPGIYD